MKLHEVLLTELTTGGLMGMGGAGGSSLSGPGTMISTQVVQPRTLQADMPEQDREYEKAKSRQKEQHKIEVDEYNTTEVDELSNYFDRDNRIEQLAKKINQTVFALKKEPDLQLAQNYTHFAKKIDRDLKSNLNKRED